LEGKEDEGLEKKKEGISGGNRRHWEEGL